MRFATFSVFLNRSSRRLLYANRRGNDGGRTLCSLDSRLDEIRGYLDQHPGGKIDLEMDEEDGIATITLNHPERKNAMSGSMMVELSDAVARLEGWTAGKALLLRGAGETFCSGGDLNTVRHIAADAGSADRMCAWMQTTLTRMLSLPMISVALVQGFALGGGAELALGCDHRLLSRSARIGFIQAHAGVVPGWGGGTRLVRLIGPTLALRLLATADTLTAEEALAVGLACGVVADGDADVEARDWLRRRTRAPAAVVRATKRVVAAAARLPLEEALEEERRLFAPVFGGPTNKLRSGKKLTES